MTGEKRINTDLVEKMFAMLFTDNENEQGTAAKLLVKAFKNANIHPSSIKIHICGNSETFLAQVIEERNAIELELENTLSDLEEALEEIATLREENLKFKNGDIQFTPPPSTLSTSTIPLSELESTNPSWTEFVSLCSKVVDIQWGWKSKIATYLTKNSNGKLVTHMMISHWKANRSKIPKWVIEMLMNAQSENEDYPEVA